MFNTSTTSTFTLFSSAQTYEKATTFDPRPSQRHRTAARNKHHPLHIYRVWPIPLKLNVSSQVKRPQLIIFVSALLLALLREHGTRSPSARSTFAPSGAHPTQKDYFNGPMPSYASKRVPCRDLRSSDGLCEGRVGGACETHHQHSFRQAHRALGECSHTSSSLLKCWDVWLALIDSAHRRELKRSRSWARGWRGCQDCNLEPDPNLSSSSLPPHYDDAKEFAWNACYAKCHE
ncbi:hypothetical protein V8E36_008577 [Tilletia maclaganii]